MVSYENYEIKNNVFGTLSAPISSLATTIQLGDGQGQRFSTNQLATLENIENGKVMKREIVLITTINGDVLTVERKYAPCPANDDANTQGKVSYAFSTDDTISAYIDKEHFDEIDKSINDIYDNGVNKLRTEVVSGLQIKVNAGPILVGSSYYDFEGGNLTLTDNATNYVEIDEDGLLVSNTTNWTLENTKIARIITSSGTITSIEDRRLGTVGGKIGGTDIHELTEKAELNPDDEFIIADSENIRQNKKINGGNVFGIGNTVTMENLLKGDFLALGRTPISTEVNGETRVGFVNEVQKISVIRVGNGITFDTMKLYIAKIGTPLSDLVVRIETDNGGVPSGTLVDQNAEIHITASSLSTTLEEKTITFGGNITIEKGVACHIVISTSTISDTNCYKIGGIQGHSNTLKLLQFDGTNRSEYQYYGEFIDLSGLTLNSSTSSGYSQPNGIYRSRDGMHMASCAQGTAFFIRTAGTPFSLTLGNETTKTGLSNRGYPRVSEDGTKVILGTTNGHQLYYGTMTSPRDASTVAFAAYDVNSAWGVPYPRGFYIKPDGTKMYIINTSGDICEITFSTPFDITTGTKTGQVSVPINPYCIFLSDDGKKIYFSTQDGTWKIYEYTLTTARDITTLTTTGSKTSSGLGAYKQLGYITNQGGISYAFLYDANNNSYYKFQSSNIGGDDISIYSDNTGFESNFIVKANAVNQLPSIPMSAINNFNIGETAKYRIDISKISGLIVGQTYYLSDTPGQISTTPGTNYYPVGKAIDSDILLLGHKNIVPGKQYIQYEFINSNTSLNLSTTFSKYGTSISIEKTGKYLFEFFGAQVQSLYINISIRVNGTEKYLISTPNAYTSNTYVPLFQSGQYDFEQGDTVDFYVNSSSGSSGKVLRFGLYYSEQ